MKTNVSPVILAFDTSDHHCGAVIFDRGGVVSALHEPMQKGQAERLFPMIDANMTAAGVEYSDLDAIGVGIGPGNFTGIRIAVSAARGLSLALSVPAVGVSLFDALALDAPNAPLLLSLKAARTRVYLQRRNGPEISETTISALDDLPHVPANTICIGAFSPDIGERLGINHQPAKYAPAAAIAHIAAKRWQSVSAPPAPLYIRKADALPSSDPPPVILPNDA